MVLNSYFLKNKAYHIIKDTGTWTKKLSFLSFGHSWTVYHLRSYLDVHQYEYLGMILDDKLSINDYLAGVWKQTNAEIGILSKNRRFISEKTATRVYKCMIRPHLDYIDFVIDSGSADRIRKLDKLQKKAIRRIEYCSLPANRKDIEVLQDLQNFEPLRLIRKWNLIKIMYSESRLDGNIQESKLIMQLGSA